MRKLRRWLLVGLILTIPLAASACRIDIGNGCQLLIGEPGPTSAGVICNL
jgi:hypothetical protein